MSLKWIYSSDDPIMQTIFGCILIFLLVIFATRIIGLRSFAKFTAYDFAVTIAIGSIISSTLTSSTSIVQGFVAIFSLLILTYIFSVLQRKFPKLNSLISNDPLLLMDGNKILYDNLQYARIQEEQLISKLREANVLNFNQVLYVILESTGDISVLHKSENENDVIFEQKLLKGVRRKP